MQTLEQRQGVADPAAAGVRFGALLTAAGLVSAAQLDSALRIQSRSPIYRPIGQILVEQGALTQRQLNLALDRFRKRARLGDLLVRAGHLSPEQLARALEHQRATGLRLGFALCRLNLVAAEVMKQTLCIQLGIPYRRLGDRVVLATEPDRDGAGGQEVERARAGGDAPRRESGDAPAASAPAAVLPGGALPRGVADAEPAPPRGRPAPGAAERHEARELAALRAAHRVLLAEHRALRERYQAVLQERAGLRERCAALCRQRAAAAAALEAVVRRLRA